MTVFSSAAAVNLRVIIASSGRKVNILAWRALHVPGVGCIVCHRGETIMLDRYVWTLGLAILSQVAYHIGQRAVPRTAAPFVVLTIAYAIACAVCLGSARWGGSATLAGLRGSLSWSTWLIALSIVGIELGFLLAYRSGWTIGLAFAVSSTSTVVILAVIGMIAQGDPISARRLVGLALACVSLWLISGGRANH